MYKIIQTLPTAEQMDVFKMREMQEDAFIDFQIDLNALTDAKKQELCDLFGVVPELLAGEKSLTLSFPSEV